MNCKLNICILPQKRWIPKDSEQNIGSLLLTSCLCPVMLLRNINGKLMNGLCDKIIDPQSGSISVHLPTINDSHSNHRYTYSVYDMKKKLTVAENEQFPLRIAYAIILHKSHGLTLDYVCVHCEGILNDDKQGCII